MVSRLGALVVVAALLRAGNSFAQADVSPPAPTPAPAPPEAKPARPRIAIIALATGEVPAQLADDLTALLEAEVARRGGFEVAPKEEFRARLGVAEDRRAVACLVEMPCLGRVGTELGVTRVLSATLGRRGDDFLLSVTLIDLLTARSEGRVFKQITGGLPALVREAKEAARRVFEPVPLPGALRVSSSVPQVRVYLDDAFLGTTPLAKPDVPAGPHRLRAEREGRRPLARRIDVPAGETLELSLDPKSLPERPRWPAYAAWGALSLAGASAIGGVFYGVLSQELPRGGMREVFADLDRKEGDAFRANALFVTAGVLGAVSATVLWVWRAEIFDLGGSVEVSAGPGRVAARLQF